MTVWDLLVLAVRMLPALVNLVVFIVKKIKNKRRPPNQG